MSESNIGAEERLPDPCPGAEIAATFCSVRTAKEAPTVEPDEAYDADPAERPTPRIWEWPLAVVIAPVVVFVLAYRALDAWLRKEGV